MKKFNEYISESKDGPKGKDLGIFVRFGGLDLKNQKGFGSDTFHAPPAPRGFYAFPKIAQEMFLVGSLGKTQPGIIPKDPNDINFDYDKYNKRVRKVYQNIRREFRKDSGNIWHHLSVPNNEVICRFGSWVKTDMSSWKKAFMKETIRMRYGEKGDSGCDLSSRSINTPIRSGISGIYCKDRFEVFFDEKV